jgi:hypothetical protein
MGNDPFHQFYLIKIYNNDPSQCLIDLELRWIFVINSFIDLKIYINKSYPNASLFIIHASFMTFKNKKMFFFVLMFEIMFFLILFVMFSLVLFVSFDGICIVPYPPLKSMGLIVRILKRYFVCQSL